MFIKAYVCNIKIFDFVVFLKLHSRSLATCSQRTLTMFVGVVAFRYQHHTCVVLITECHNSHKHSQSPLTSS